MNLAQKLSQLRPLMTPAEITALLGAKEAARIMDTLSNYERDTGVWPDFSHADRVLDSIRFTDGNFLHNVSVCGISIGMTFDAVKEVYPSIHFDDSRTDNPHPSGCVFYKIEPDGMNFIITLSLMDGRVDGFSLERADLLEAWERRDRKEAERRAERDRRIERLDRWKSIEDPNDMLLDWASANSDDGDGYLKFARWLVSTRDPDVWHVVAKNWNWDRDTAPLVWIIRQNDTDIATALEIFWLASPYDYFSQYGTRRSDVPPDWQLEHFDFIREIAQRVRSGFYKRSEIAFNGEHHMGIVLEAMKKQGKDRPTDDDEFRAFYPPESGRNIPGRDPEDRDDLDEGISLTYPLN